MRETLSPTPPVECLSTVFLPTLLRSKVTPESTIALVQYINSSGSIPLKKIDIAKAAACSSGMFSLLEKFVINQLICSLLRTPPSLLV